MENNDLYDPKSHDFSGNSSIGQHVNCVLCGSPESHHDHTINRHEIDKVLGTEKCACGKCVACRRRYEH